MTLAADKGLTAYRRRWLPTGGAGRGGAGRPRTGVGHGGEGSMCANSRRQPSIAGSGGPATGPAWA